MAVTYHSLYTRSQYYIFTCKQLPKLPCLVPSLNYIHGVYTLANYHHYHTTGKHTFTTLFTLHATLHVHENMLCTCCACHDVTTTLMWLYLGCAHLSLSLSLADLTPVKIAAKPTNLSSPFPYNYRTNITILEESEKFDQPQERYRSKSVSQPRTTSSASSSPRHVNNIFNLDSPVDQNYSHFNNHHRQHSNPLILGPDIPHNYDKLRGPPPPRDSETPGSGSDSGYADPIDALRQYYSSQYQGGNIPVSEPPYQTLAEIQRIRQARLNLNRTDSPEDPAYSRPFDCLRGLPGPVRISGETTPGIAMPQNFQHTNPTGRSRMKKRVHRQPFHASSGSDDALSSSPSLSPSPEPEDITPLTSSQRSGSLDCLLEPPTIQKVRVKLKEDSSHRMRQRVHSEGNLLAQKKLSSRPDILSPLALTTSTASEQDRTPSSSPQPSPIHVPVPVEVLKLHNGFAKLVHPSSSSSQSQ